MLVGRPLLLIRLVAAADWQVNDSQVAVGMLASVAEPYKTRAEGVMSTWAPYFQAFRAYTFDDVTDSDIDKFVHVPRQFDEEVYHNINLAMIPLLLDEFPDAEWYVQVDDDTLMLPHSLLDVVKDLQPEDEYILGGKCVGYRARHKKHGDIDVPFVVGGAGIVISRKLALALAPHISQCRDEPNDWDYGDAKIGGCIEWKLPEAKPVQCFAGMTNTLICDDDSLLNADKWTELHPDGETAVSLHLKKEFSFQQAWDAVQGSVDSMDPMKWDEIREQMASITCAGDVEVDPHADPVALLGASAHGGVSYLGRQKDPNRQECEYNFRAGVKTVAWEQACMKYYFTMA